jgi:hypothetical protein
MTYPKSNIDKAIIIGIFSIMLHSCAESPKTPVTQPTLTEDGVTNTGNIKLSGEIISIPPPMVTLSLLEKNKVQFNPSLPNPTANKTRYVGETKKALNLGVYGADLAYCSDLKSGQPINDYVSAVAALANDLGALEKIDQALVSKFISNIEDKDSLNKASSEFYKLCDRYLRQSEQQHLSSYVLIGGWVEALYLSSDAAKTDEQLAMRLGEQKYSAPSIMKLASQLNDQAFVNIKEELNELCTLLAALESSYKYEKPINDRNAQTTYLMSKTQVNITLEQLTAIAEKTTAVRNLIIE